MTYMSGAAIKTSAQGHFIHTVVVPVSVWIHLTTRMISVSHLEQPKLPIWSRYIHHAVSGNNHANNCYAQALKMSQTKQSEYQSELKAVREQLAAATTELSAKHAAKGL